MCPLGTGYNSLRRGRTNNFYHSSRQRQRKAVLAQSGDRQRSGKRRLREGKRGRQRTGVAREGFLDRRSKRGFWLLLSPQTKVARAGAQNYPLRRGRGLYAAARRHLIRPLRGHLPLKGKADGGVSFNAADPSRGRLTEACHSTPRPIKGEGFWGAAFSTADSSRGKADGGTPLKGKA